MHNKMMADVLSERGRILLPTNPAINPDPTIARPVVQIYPIVCSIVAPIEVIGGE